MAARLLRPAKRAAAQVGGVTISCWADQDVALALERAAKTLRLLKVSGARPAKTRTAFPDVVQAVWETDGDRDQEPKLGPPRAARIDEMDEVIGWLFWIDEPNTRIVLWGRAMGIKTGRIAKRLGVHSETVRRWRRAGLETILRRLNGTA